MLRLSRLHRSACGLADSRAIDANPQAAVDTMRAKKKTRPAWLGLDGPYQVNPVVCLAGRLRDLLGVTSLALLYKKLSPHDKPNGVTTGGLDIL
ncbi:MAG TPA: hypothetical protein VGY55_24550 [Pirellulales bacterium]|jgi:hypothetical protein|nr:hypothetical protein [Pirellulales bacterium]